MHEYFEIKAALSAILEAAGYVEASESCSVDCYGSISTHYSKGDGNEGWAKTGWDGIGGYGYASTLGSKGWLDLNTKVFESNAVEFKNSTNALVAELARSLK